VVVVLNDKKKKKKSIYQSISEDSLYPMLNEMGYTEDRINAFQRKRVWNSIFMFVLLVVSAALLGSWLYILAILAPVATYKLKFRSIKDSYRVWKFKRHLQFTKFMRLLIPYLKQTKANVALYTIFNKILKHMENEEDRNNLTRLMSGITNSPNDVQPFKEFALRSSGTARSILFMSTIFDFQQGGFDISVIDELGKEASKELMIGIDEIINYKLNRFNGFPTKVVYALLIFISGFALGVLGTFLGELLGGGLVVMP